jgi:hypothetical protein
MPLGLLGGLGVFCRLNDQFCSGDGTMGGFCRMSLTF